MVVNSHLPIHDRFYGFTSCSRTSTTSSIVSAFLRSTSCGMTSARDHGVIVYCMNSGSEDRQTGSHNGEEEGKKGRKKSGENGRKEKKKTGEREETEKDKKKSRGERREEPALYGEKG
ncbi:hypothetical protein TNCV_4455541 [Trichonephila clavipes]|nr:hypothetical protein TNCV_4455541 [Trichonephila clavipes]